MIRMFAGLAAIVALAVSTPAGIATAQGVFVGPPGNIVSPRPLDGKRGRVAQELRLYGFRGADVTQLSDRTIALLDNALHSGRSQGDTAARIRSILSGGGILQRTIDRTIRRY